MNISSIERPLLDDLLEPLSHCIYGKGEDDLLSLRAGPKLQKRIDELATKCDEGLLTDKERSEYETYIRFGNFVGILQAKAKRKGKSAVTAK
jgi:hypothetical protein